MFKVLFDVIKIYRLNTLPVNLNYEIWQEEITNINIIRKPR